ncbi:hypothetical protein SESBI_24155 [Sesbania bispinosa]|nr:hypothetical protein SESBI_24155 [Sesbania bispinosa]
MKNTLALSLSIAIVYIVTSEFGIAFSRASTALAPEPPPDSPSPDYILPAEPPAPYYSPPADSAESPEPDNSPSAGSAESTEPGSMPLRYFDLTLYGAVADGKTDSSSVSY